MYIKTCAVVHIFMRWLCMVRLVFMHVSFCFLLFNFLNDLLFQTKTQRRKLYRK